MEPVSPRLEATLRGRGRELAVLAAGLAAGAALAWAGATVHDGLRTASEVAVARLSGAVEDTVITEWQRMLRASEPPVAPAGETFSWRIDEHGSLDGRLVAELEGTSFVVGDVGDVDEDPLPLETELSVFWTLLDEAERLELVEQDHVGALELVLEALDKETEDPERAPRPEGWLRALQLGARLGRSDIVRGQWERLRATDLAEGESLPWTEERIPYRLLAWMALPAEIRDDVPSADLVGARELEHLLVAGDRLVLGPPEEPIARFELAPLLVVVCERLGLPLPPLERRKVNALAKLEKLPELLDDGRWCLRTFAGRPFVARREGGAIRGSFYAPRDPQAALAEHSALPEGFRLDFEGDWDDLGPGVRPRASLPDSDLAFTLRHRDPAGLGRAEAARLRLLRAALFTLALACAAGGFLSARVLARQRKLAELKSAFIAGVSHDLRTPLASILLLAENLETGVAEGADRARYHRALGKEAARLRRLVDDVLDFSRLERGAAPQLEREGLELDRFMLELAADCRARVAGEGRPFAFEHGPLPESATLDAHAVRRALENLLDNALKHGKGCVRLACSSADGRLRLSVADEGPGVPAAARERVFEPFERLGGNGHAGGAGLGLAIVRAIARGHGGEARVRPGPDGAGAVFELDLPLEEVHA